MFMQALDNLPWYQVKHPFANFEKRYLEYLDVADKSVTVYFTILRLQDYAVYFGDEYIIEVPQH